MNIPPCPPTVNFAGASFVHHHDYDRLREWALSAVAVTNHDCDHEWQPVVKMLEGQWQDGCVICGKRRFASQDAIRTCFYEVVWKATEASEMSFVSDPFATSETAMDYAKWRDGRGEPSQIWQIVKTKELLRK